MRWGTTDEVAGSGIFEPIAQKVKQFHMILRTQRAAQAGAAELGEFLEIYSKVEME